MGAEVEIVLCRVGDVGVHGGSGGNIPRPPRLVSLVGTKQPQVEKFFFIKPTKNVGRGLEFCFLEPDQKKFKFKVTSKLKQGMGRKR